MKAPGPWWQRAGGVYPLLSLLAAGLLLIGAGELNFLALSPWLAVAGCTCLLAGLALSLSWLRNNETDPGYLRLPLAFAAFVAVLSTLLFLLLILAPQASTLVSSAAFPGLQEQAVRQPQPANASSALITCLDGTLEGECSANSSAYCNQTLQLEPDCGRCGCFAGQKCQSNGSCTASTCSDGTPYGSCATGKPAYCDAAGQLVQDCSLCGCPQVASSLTGNYTYACRADGTCKLAATQQECNLTGGVWCNGGCAMCAATQYVDCPAGNGPFTCVNVVNVSALEQSVVYINNEVTGCCTSPSAIGLGLGDSGSGVIVAEEGENVTVLTARHLVDCVYDGSCTYPTSNYIMLKTFDGATHLPTFIQYAPDGLDLAVVQFQEFDPPYPAVPVSPSPPTLGEEVTQVGYPAYGPVPQGYNLNLSQYSVSNGTVTGALALDALSGRQIIGIQSDAYSNPNASIGSSGGGLFDSDGQLLGTVAWKPGYGAGGVVAVSSQLLNFLGSFQYCGQNYYLASQNPGICCPFGQIYGQDGSCHPPCVNATSYCLPHYSCRNSQCVW